MRLNSNLYLRNLKSLRKHDWREWSLGGDAWALSIGVYSYLLSDRVKGWPNAEIVWSKR